MSTRREFLKLLGIGGVSAVAAPSLGLFSTGGAFIVGSSNHYVYYENAPILAPGSSAHFLFKSSDGEVSRLALRAPGWGKKTWSPRGTPYTYTAPVEVLEGEDPHIAFYLAAQNMRDQISEDTQTFAKNLGASLMMVSVVTTPIFAAPLPDKGFSLHCELEQYAVAKEDVQNPEAADSLYGDVPIETPGDIHFKYLMLLQEELAALGMLGTPSIHTLRKIRTAQRARGLLA